MKNPEIEGLSEKIKVVESTVSFDELLDLLVASGIPVHEWGTGTAKTVQHLLSEIQEAETMLYIDDQGALHREVSVLWIDVLHEAESGEVYYLREEKQVFKDGREKRRALDSSLGEKMKPDERPEAAAIRALSEEIGVTEARSLYFIETTQKTHTPDTYPGLESEYKMHKYVSTISDDAFRTEGYTEEQADKTNFYTWQQIH